VRLGLTVWATLGGLLLVLPSLRAADLSPKLKELLREAQDLQEKGDKGDYLAYIQAWEKYQQIRRAEHNPPREVIDGSQFCLRRVQQARRLRDKPSHVLLGDLSSSEALNLYAEVLADLREKYYFDRNRINFADLFQHGVQELRFALEEKEFLKEHVRDDVKPDALQALRAQLEGLRLEQPTIKKPADAREQLQSVMLAAAGVGIKPTPVLVEFLSGACSALDEYTSYLSPRRLAEIEADLSGKYVGIGIAVALSGKGEKGPRQLVVNKVFENGPAYGKLHENDVILSIDGQKMDPSMPGAFAARLEGEEGSSIELEVQSADGTKRKEKIERQVVFTPSVQIVPTLSGIGYIRLLTFQKTTPQELQSAVLQLRSQPEGLRALVLDLRGNLGGSFEAGAKVAELFLSDGIIVYTQMGGKFSKEKPRRANNPDAFTMPLVVLVDGNTASAAELVAGALKDNLKDNVSRATLIGQPTFGKGSIQCLLPLKSLKAGLHVTVARFSSPERVPYDGNGVTPHELVENSMMMGDMRADPQSVRAVTLAKEKAEKAEMMMPNPLQKPPMN
jgi:carboxyl-terminal processing protease